MINNTRDSDRVEMAIFYLSIFVLFCFLMYWYKEQSHTSDVEIVLKWLPYLIPGVVG